MAYGTYIPVIILFICPEDKSEEEQDCSDHRELKNSGHHPPHTGPNGKRLRFHHYYETVQLL